MQNKEPCHFVKVKDCVTEGRTRFIRYDSKTYIFTISCSSECAYMYTQIHTRGDCPRYTPAMYVREDDDYRPIGIEIQTTSYGALSPEEIQKNIDALQMAIDTAAAIQDKFIDPIRTGTFDFDEPITQEEGETC